MPRLARASPVDAGLRVAAAVGGVGAGARGDVPQLGVVRVDGHRPGVVAVAPLVGRLPALARVLAEGGAAATRLVRPAMYARVPGERVDVPLRAGAGVLPANTAI